MSVGLAGIEEILAAAQKLNAADNLRNFMPYGHPDCASPDGPYWQMMNRRGLWEEWSDTPWQTDWCNATIDHPEVALLAANGVGKTWIGAYHVAVHMTGLYPDWWRGRRFEKPNYWWVGSITNELQQEGTQAKLIGPDMGEGLGQGMIPKELIVGKPSPRQAGVADICDVVKVRHVPTGGMSRARFKVYAQGWRVWQAAAPDGVWLDEEPEDMRIYTEAQTRVLRTNGLILVTLTPLLGVTDLILKFQEPKTTRTYWVGATWDDAPHLSERDKTELRQEYPEHEVEARTKGVPMMGEGRIFTVGEDDLKVDPFPIPHWFARIKGIDFGIDHPAGVADIAWDRDKDIIYVTRVWKERNCTAEEHAEKINEVDPWVPVAWPHDGTQRDKRSGKQLSMTYRQYGCRFLARSACYDSKVLGGQPVEPIIMHIDDRCRSGGFQVFSSCGAFFDEYRNYHRKDGVVVAKRDDILKSVFYAVMMRRYAKVPERAHRSTPQGIPCLSTRVS